MVLILANESAAATATTVTTTTNKTVREAPSTTATEAAAQSVPTDAPTAVENTQAENVTAAIPAAVEAAKPETATATTSTKPDAENAGASTESESEDEDDDYPHKTIRDPEGRPRRDLNYYLEAEPSERQYRAEDMGKGDPRIEQSTSDDTPSAEDKKPATSDKTSSPPAPVYRVLEEKWNMNDYQWQAVQPAKTCTQSKSAYAFCVHRRQVQDSANGTHKVMIRIMSPPLAKVLQKLVDPHDRLYDSVPFLPIDHIYASRVKLEAWLVQYESHDAQATTDLLNKLSVEDLAKAAEAIRHLLKVMHDEFAETMRKYHELIADGLITYELLWLMFNVGDHVVFQHEVIDQAQAMKVTSVQYVPAGRDDPAYLSVRGTTLEWSGKHFFTDEVRRGITIFPGPRPIHELSLQLLSRVDEPTKTDMATRGRRYAQFTDVHYKSYRGSLIRRAGCRIIQVPCRGRVVIDRKGMIRENPNWPISVPRTRTCERNGLDSWVAPDLDGSNFTDVDYMRMPPTVYGFSLAKKVWGELLVDHITDINFDTHVWDKLVLAASTKRLIKGLVESHVAGGLVTDIIEGKGQGLIFLLHGSPGQGKTLTAEAISEQLQRPLYSVGVGELGQEPNELETNLQSALNLAEAWNAILLLDEADVFLEQRSNHEMHRNACVAIFLRTLEFYSGILFLTTNRVASFDAAFHSRISLALRYPDLNKTSRHAIWTQVLDRIHHGDHAAWADRIPLTDLVKLPLNGRRIKGVLRTAQAMAAHEKVHLTSEHIETVIELVRGFAEDLESVVETPNGTVARSADPGLVPQMLAGISADARE